MLVDVLNKQSELHEVSLIIINRKIDNALLFSISARVNVFQLNRPEGSGSPVFALKLNLLLLKLRPFCIHCHNHNIIGLILLQRARTFLTVHRVGMESRHLIKYKTIFSISKSVQTDLLDRLGLRSILIYNGIDVGLIRSRRSYSVGSFFRIVNIARLDHFVKGQDTLLLAVKELINQFRIENICVDFIGSGSSLNYLKQMVGELGLEKNVNFLGAQSRNFIYENLQAYHLLVQPSLSEGFGLTVVEGMAAGLPVLVTDGDGPEEIVKLLKSGYVVPKGSVVDLSLGIRKVIEGYSSGRLSVVTNRNIIFENFDISNTASRYIEYYS